MRLGQRMLGLLSELARRMVASAIACVRVLWETLRLIGQSCVHAKNLIIIGECILTTSPNYPRSAACPTLSTNFAVSSTGRFVVVLQILNASFTIFMPLSFANRSLPLHCLMIILMAHTRPLVPAPSCFQGKIKLTLQESRDHRAQRMKKAWRRAHEQAELDPPDDQPETSVTTSSLACWDPPPILVLKSLPRAVCAFSDLRSSTSTIDVKIRTRASGFGGDATTRYPTLIMQI